MDRYYRYSDYLQDKYGVKTYKLPVNLPLTCPNRDGTLSRGGCSYCGEEGASFDTAGEKTVQERLLELKEPIARKYGAEKFIAYFQNYTNTYLPLGQLKDNVAQALQIEDVVEVALATRPDCINEEYISELQGLITAQTPEVKLTVELGLQTVNYRTLQRINRGHTLAEFIDAVQTVKKYGGEVGTHLILNLPGDDRVDVVESARVVSALGVDTVKLHALYIREGTELADKYREGKLDIISLDEYIERVVAFLEHLDPEIGVQRLLGKAPQEGTLFVNWGYNYSEINNFILEKMEAEDSWQGQKFDYLDGKALRKFD
jgi:radical SAM protein (TIGR01212 family)